MLRNLLLSYRIIGFHVRPVSDSVQNARELATNGNHQSWGSQRAVTSLWPGVPLHSPEPEETGPRTVHQRAFGCQAPRLPAQTLPGVDSIQNSNSTPVCGYLNCPWACLAQVSANARPAGFLPHHVVHGYKWRLPRSWIDVVEVVITHCYNALREYLLQLME